MADTYGIPDPEAANLTALTQQQIVCYISQSTNEYDGNLGARISSIFVIGAVSTFCTFFPVVAKRVPRFHIPLYVYLFARYFGSGVIVATAFIHLLDPAYEEIGPASCVGLTGGWATYSWPPALALGSSMFIFLMDFVAERYVEMRYGVEAEQNLESAMTGATSNGQSMGVNAYNSSGSRRSSGPGGILDSRREHVDRSQVDTGLTADAKQQTEKRAFEKKFMEDTSLESGEWQDEQARRLAVQQQIAAFLILEFGVIFHSVIIGLNLGVAGDEFSTLYVVLVFHQSFEGMGIGARLSAIPLRKGSWLPWLLCTAYGLTTPISIAIGLGVHTTYNSGSYTASVVSGVLDSISAGILIYTGFVELLARDFLFNPLRTKNNFRLGFMVVCVFLGAGIMALLGKWA